MEKNALASPRELGEILAEWSAIRLPAGASPKGKLIPDLYMVLSEEEDFDALLRRIHETLKGTGLLSFEGPMPCYSYFLELLEEDGRFLSSRDFFDIYRKNLSHMGRPFKGILGIEITDWVERRGTSAQKFTDFLTFLQTIDKDAVIVFLSTCQDQNKNEDAFLDRTKYVRLLSRTIRGRRRYFVQIVKEGKPPRKNRTVGSADSAVGIDIGPSAVAYYSTGEKKAAIEPLAPNACCEELDRKVGRLQRCMARSLEASNPDAKDENGRWKKGVKLNKSKRWEKNRVKLANLKRRLAVNRRQDHEKAANRIIALGTDVRVEDTPITSWTKRAKETTVRKKDGKINRKKRFGKSVANHAPGLLLNCIARKLGNVGKELKRVKSSKVKASQRNHVDGSCRKKELSERWFEVDGRRVQRDLYSSWLIAHVMENGEEIDLIACQDDWPNFLRAQAEALAKAPKNLGIL